jgi:hypothetical protein
MHTTTQRCWAQLLATQHATVCDLNVCPWLHRASREFSIEKALEKMMADWEGLTFELGTWKNTGTFILKGEHTAAPHACAAQRAAGYFHPTAQQTAANSLTKSHRTAGSRAVCICSACMLQKNAGRISD